MFIQIVTKCMVKRERLIEKNKPIVRITDVYIPSDFNLDKIILALFNLRKALSKFFIEASRQIRLTQLYIPTYYMNKIIIEFLFFFINY